MSSSQLLSARALAKMLLRRDRDNVWRQHPNLDIFGEVPEEPTCPPSEVRVIEITDEVRAADAAERATREAKPGVTWRRPDPVPPPTYILPAGRSNGQRRSKKFKASAPPAPKVASPAKPQPKPTRKTRRPNMSFSIGDPIHINDAPPPHQVTPPRAKAWPLFEALRKLTPEQFLPVTFPEVKAAYYQVSALRKIAKTEGFKIEMRPDLKDPLKKFLRVVKAESQLSEEGLKRPEGTTEGAAA